MSDKNKTICPAMDNVPPLECETDLNTAFQFSSVVFYKNGSVGDSNGNYWGEWKIFSETKIEVSRNYNEIIMAFDLDTGEVAKELQYIDSLVLENPIQKRILSVSKERIAKLKKALTL
jgi:hypothetical protein